MPDTDRSLRPANGVAPICRAAYVLSGADAVSAGEAEDVPALPRLPLLLGCGARRKASSVGAMWGFIDLYAMQGSIVNFGPCTS